MQPKVYELSMYNGATDKLELEGIFTTLGQIALYLEVPKNVVNAIFNSEYDRVPANLYDAVIKEVNDESPEDVDTATATLDIGAADEPRQ